MSLGEVWRSCSHSLSALLCSGASCPKFSNSVTQFHIKQLAFYPAFLWPVWGSDHGSFHSNLGLLKQLKSLKPASLVCSSGYDVWTRIPTTGVCAVLWNVLMSPLDGLFQNYHSKSCCLLSILTVALLLTSFLLSSFFFYLLRHILTMQFTLALNSSCYGS